MKSSFALTSGMNGCRTPNCGQLGRNSDRPIYGLSFSSEKSLNTCVRISIMAAEKARKVCYFFRMLCGYHSSKNKKIGTGLTQGYNSFGGSG